jgi:hypothetical protein
VAAPTVAGRGGGRATAWGRRGRGRGVPLIELDPGQPCELLPDCVDKRLIIYRLM